MANTYFQFKQFRVEQDQCAMKVCTDSCLFGAWLKPDSGVQSILDIGTGTGLLSLMLAQKTTCEIVAVELDDAACRQAKANIQDSPWRDRISVFSGDIKTFPLIEKYDFIVCNPPFYEKEMGSQLPEEKIAKHSLHLSLKELFSIAAELLTAKGKFAVLLPYYRKNEAEALAATYQLYPQNSLRVKQTPNHAFFRYAVVFSSQQTEILSEEMSVKDERNEYSEKFADILRPYYLYL